MKYDPAKHHRRSIRLKGYDYSQAGAYFVTIVTREWASLFGAVTARQMRLNDAGGMMERWWLELNHKFPAIETDEYVIMPNHFHGIVIIGVGADLRVGPDLCVGPPCQGAHVGAPPDRARTDWAREWAREWAHT